MAIEQFGKITYNDINNLNNESITTGNIYASGTSANIGTAENPFNNVYANYYYGTKFQCTLLKKFTLLPSGGFTTVGDMSQYSFICFYVNGWGATPIFLPWEALKEKDNASNTLYMYGSSNNAVVFYQYHNTQIYAQDSLTNGYGTFHVFGFN